MDYGYSKLEGANGKKIGDYTQWNKNYQVEPVACDSEYTNLQAFTDSLFARTQRLKAHHSRGWRLDDINAGSIERNYLIRRRLAPVVR